MTELNIPAPIWISDNESLIKACDEWKSSAYISLDTEFIRTTTFYPQPGLFQLATDKACWLLDPLSITDWAPFNELMVCPEIIKVFHACLEDLEVCRQLLGVLPTPLFDTQMGLAYIGEGGSVGFQRAVAGILDVDIPKGATRTNWLQRPLTEHQVEYATADVYYLHQLYPKILARLEALGRLSWLQEDCARVIELASAVSDDYSQAYQRVKLGWKLRPQEQYVLQQLSIWREVEARERDVPRNKIADDPTLWNMCRFKARNRDQLQKAGLRAQVLRDQGKVILRIIADALDAPASEWPSQLERPLHIEAADRQKKMKKLVVNHAEKLDIPPELLANKRILDVLIRSEGNVIPEALSGWRMAQIGRPLIDWLSAGDVDVNLSLNVDE